MSYGGPSEGLSTVRGHRPLEWRSLPQFSLFCSLMILEPGLECSCLLRVADRQGSLVEAGAGKRFGRKAR